MPSFVTSSFTLVGTAAASPAGLQRGPSGPRRRRPQGCRRLRPALFVPVQFAAEGLKYPVSAAFSVGDGNIEVGAGGLRVAVADAGDRLTVTHLHHRLVIADMGQGLELVPYPVPLLGAVEHNSGGGNGDRAVVHHCRVGDLLSTSHVDERALDGGEDLLTALELHRVESGDGGCGGRTCKLEE